METRKIFTILVLALGLVVCLAQVGQAEPMGTAFTYQGRLMDANEPANGLYDFQFKLYDSNDPCTGAQLASPIDINDLDVIDGHFIVELDFGSAVFDGNAVWLETRVVESPLGSDPCTLSPLLELTPTPYALYAKTAGSASGGGWVDDGAVVRLESSGDSVGIGTTSPSAKLDVEVSSGGAATIGSSSNSATGDYAIATGDNTTASGPYSTAMGRLTTASGFSSTAMGWGTDASDQYSTAMGRDTDASGYASTAMGRLTTASGSYSTAMGILTVASGDYSTAMGREIEAQGNFSVAIALNDQNGVVVSQDNTMAIMGGNVGIGTTGPTAKLDVIDSSSGPIISGTNTGTGYAGNFGQTGSSNSNGGLNVTTAAGQYGAKILNQGGYSGYGYGLHVTSEKDTGSYAYGIQSIANHNNNYAYGLMADATSANSYAYGGYFRALAGGDFVRGISINADNTKATSGGASYGIQLDSASYNGAAVGLRSNVWAGSPGNTSNLYGIYSSGSHSGTSGTSYGMKSYIHGSDTGDSYGIYSEGNKWSSDTAGTAYGGYFIGDNDMAGGLSYGVYGENTTSGNYGYLGGNNAGVFGKNTSNDNRCYLGATGAGVEAYSNTGYAVYGNSTSGYAVYGYSASGRAGYFYKEGRDDYAGYFYGNVHIDGTLSKTAGSFKIDHPLDPENKYLQHSFVESPDMMNVYNGNVVLDKKGEATVELPDYFEALNNDFRYQLSCIGGFAPVYIAEEISNNRFKIAGGKAAMKVSWQVTGIRQDAYAKANRIVVEENKSTEERGYYLYPQGYGFGKDKSIERLHAPEPIEQVKKAESEVNHEKS